MKKTDTTLFITTVPSRRCIGSAPTQAENSAARAFRKERRTCHFPHTRASYAGIHPERLRYFSIGAGGQIMQSGAVPVRNTGKTGGTEPTGPRISGGNPADRRTRRLPAAAPVKRRLWRRVAETGRGESSVCGGRIRRNGCPVQTGSGSIFKGFKKGARI